MGLTYFGAQTLLKNRETKKIGNNTYLVQLSPEKIAVRLHSTNILELSLDSVQLFTGGWQSHTTKERLNDYAPVRVWQEKNLWYVGAYDNKSLYYDGMTFDYNGRLLSERKDDSKVLSKSAAMKKRINAYADICIEKIREGIALPSGADCWMCSMYTTDEHRTLGDVWQHEHLTEHMEEEYVVPSLIYNAMKEAGYRDEQFTMFCGYDETGISCKRIPAMFNGNYQMERVRKCIYKYMVKRLVTVQQ